MGCCAFHLRVNNRCQDELDDVRHKVVAYTCAHARKTQKSIDSRAPCGGGGG